MPTSNVSPEEIGPEFRPYRRQDVASVEIDSDALIYDEAHEMTHLLNPTGAIIWSVCDGHASVAGIAADLAEAFDVPTNAILADVLELIRDLGRKGLLQNVAAVS